MEKTEIGPQFQFMASWPKKSNFERIKMFFWVPHFRIFYPYKYQKMIFFHQKQKLDLNFNSWPPGPKNPSLRESKYFWVQKLFWFQDFLTFRVPKKMIFFIKNIMGYIQHILGPKIFGFFWVRRPWIKIKVQFLFLMKKSFCGTFNPFLFDIGHW